MPRSRNDGVMQNSWLGFSHRHAMPICGLAVFGHAVLVQFAPRGKAFEWRPTFHISGSSKATSLDETVGPRWRRCATHAATHFLTVSHVRVVTSRPNAFSSSVMNTGPLSLGT